MVRRKEMNKKGLTMKYLITIIILIVSFGIIALFFAMYGFDTEIDKEACHQSVIFRATVPEIEDRDVVDLPLKCETEKICISENNNGKCDRDFMGENYITKQVDDNDETRMEGIKQIFATEFYECWWMMGRGKIQVFTRNEDDTKDCILCTRIAFDEDLKTKLRSRNIQGIDGLTRYMVNNNVPNSDKSYWQYITNSESNYITNYDAGLDVFDLNQQVIVYAESKEGDFWEWIARGGVATGGAIIGSAVPLIGPVAGGGLGALITSSLLDDAIEKYDLFKANPTAGVLLRNYNFEQLRGLGCTSFGG